LGNTDSWGDVDSNAKILKNTIEKALLETRAEKVNIIAHSKGGIDSRYFIWKYGSENQVASLTTVSTPHHGSEIADLIFKQKIIHTKLVKKTLKVFDILYGDINTDLYNVNHQLTTEKMKEFNQNIKADEKVYYQSIYTAMKNSFDDLMFFYSYLYLKSISGENDGVVSGLSSRWGKNVIKIEGGISHAEIVDFKKKKISGISIPDVYINIVKGLSRKGL
jgi:triacylglycerol lipase